LAFTTRAGKRPQIVREYSGRIFAGVSRVTLEAAVGRALAVSLHPVLAWSALRPSGRIAIVLGYFGAAYLGVLTALLALR
jgi:hypothetical protein